jgi:hypothetical protein
MPRLLSLGTLTAISLVLLCALFFQLPRIQEDLPYFTREDEAHHFNRMLEMARSLELNPNYFHKPSLHFYLRLPVAWFSFYQARRASELTSFKEVQTRDPYGIAGWAFSASHPRFVRDSRALSVFLALGCVLFTFLIGLRLCHSLGLASFSALLVAVSPDFNEHAAIIGVDIPMCFFCLASIYAGLLASAHFTPLRLIGCAALAGLAISSKYNAAPIAALPLLIALLQPTSRLRWGISATAVVVCSFFAASPYILVSIPTFIEQLRYEVWHYAIAGHVGHEAQPGLPQLRFYLHWLVSSALSLPTLLLAGLSLTAIAAPERRRYFVAFFFPLLFFILMVSQKANFVRNVLVLIPALSLAAALGLTWLARSTLIAKFIRFPLLVLCIATSIIPPLQRSLEERAALLARPDSRILAQAQLWPAGKDSSPEHFKDTLVAGELWFPWNVLAWPGATRDSLTKRSPFQLYQDGFERLVLPSSSDQQSELNTYFEKYLQFSGSQEAQRIVKNPALSIYKPKAPEALLAELDVAALPTFSCTGTELLNCGDSSEGQLWIQNRWSRWVLPAGHNTAQITFEIISPWQGQEIKFSSAEKQLLTPLWLEPEAAGLTPGLWSRVQLSVPNSDPAQQAQLLVYVARVRSPKELGISRDARRLGVGVRAVSLRVLDQ